ncbi:MULTISPECIES: thioredoxin [Cysteiniphilum]|uniref:thioredoxin n=1 Tax=Cysteiniphilum TaxID=2056696 RepID=UPI0017864847|nr:thioredoxin [Cysteiniphilum sp. 19X3-34]MDA0910667.1 thioredoxin [Pseudomonadota bacterium]
MSQCINITDSEFESAVVNSEQPVLVDFWAPWCGPCKMIAPILDQVAEHYGEKLKIVKINVDDNQDTPAKFGVRGIPTLMVFKDGENVETKVGAVQKSQLIQILDKHI